MDISKLKKDLNAIAEGQWVDRIPEMGDLRLRVRGLSAPEVRDYRFSLTRAIPRDKRDIDNTPTAEAAREVLNETLYEKVLLDWDGLSDGDKPVKYNKALAKEWCTNPAFSDFADAVVWAATTVDNTRAVEVDTAVGN